jgi:hypothetical protein
VPPWLPISRNAATARASLRATLAVVLAALALGAHAQANLGDDGAAERAAAAARAEKVVTLPSFPAENDLLEFFVSEASDFEYFIDAKSLRVDGNVIYYTLVARSPEGVNNVSYEAIRCGGREYRIFAIGETNRTWRRRTTPWREIRGGGVHRWHDALRKDYFCPGGAPILSAEEGLDAIRRGRHPLVDRQGER